MALAPRILSIRKLSDLRSDESLIKAAQAGKPEAASTLIERHYPRVLSFLSYLTGSRPKAEDLAQETFTRALGALGRFNGRYRFEPWLLRIAKNLVIDESRRDLHRPSPVDPICLPDLEPVSDTVDDVWESMDSRSSTSMVTAALTRMPLRQRTVLVLREIEGLSYSEIAEIVGTNDRGVEATIRRARARFRIEALAAEGIEGERAVCKRTLRLVATEGSTVEATRHLARCSDCRMRSERVKGADKAFGLLPPIGLVRPDWMESLTGTIRSRTPAPRVSRNILEVLRGSQAGAISPLAHAVEMVASVVVAGSISVASVSGQVKKVATSAAAAPPSVSAEQGLVDLNDQVTLAEYGLRGPGEHVLATGTSGTGKEEAASKDHPVLPLVTVSSLLDINIDEMDLMAPLAGGAAELAFATIDTAIAGIADLGLDPRDLASSGSSSNPGPIEMPTLPDVTSTIAPHVALPRRRPYFA